MNTSKLQGLLDTRVFAQSSLQHPSSRFNFVTKLWKILVDALLHSDELKVSQKVDRQGRIIAWFIYDPEIGRSICFGSEMEVRLWLEHRYYR